MQRMTIDNLTQLTFPVQLYIYSCEGDIYTARARLPDGTLAIVCNQQGENLIARSLESMRDTLAGVSTERALLLHHLAYDEMIGLDSADQHPAQPLHW